MKRYSIVVTLILLFCSGCANLNDQSFRNLSKGVLSTTGLGGSGADSLLDAGFNLAEANRPFSEEQRYYLGRGVSAMILSQYPLFKNDKLTNYINSVGLVVASASPMPATFKGYKFGILDTNEINAMSAPGGFIFVSRGFLSRLPDEDALAAVLAHEVAHVSLDHGINAISQAKTMSALASAGKGALESQGGFITQEATALFGDSVADIFKTLTSRGYSRSQEYDADKLALSILTRAKYDPSRLKEVLTILEKAGNDADVEDKGWYSTHPSPERRMDNLPENIQAIEDMKSLQVRAVRFRNTTGKS